MQIRTDDEVYRVDAVWLGPPRATFPWRARYSAYGVGLLVMILVMFLQRRLGIDLGFFSVAWALLITVGITRFVARRINDERPLLEWITLFTHELRGPRARTRAIGGALGTGHVAVHRDRPRGQAGTLALPRGHVAAALPRGSEQAAPERAEAVDAGDRTARPERTASTGRAPRPAGRTSRPRTTPAGSDGFGPPSSADVGGPDPAPTSGTSSAALPPVPPMAPTAEAEMASWGAPRTAEPVAASRRPARPVGERAPGRGPRSFGPSATGRGTGGDDERGGFGPGSGHGSERVTARQEDDGATPPADA